MLLALLLVSLFTLVLLGFYVLVAAPRSRGHQTFAAFIACLALWTINDIVMWGFGGGRGLAAWWAGSSFALALMLQLAFVVFAWVFPENAEVPLRRAAVMFAPGAVLVPAALAGMMWERIDFDGADFRIRLTPLAYAFGLYIYGLFAYGFAVLLRKWQRYRGSLWGKQLGAILCALVITATLKTAANIALPLAGVYTLLPVGSVFVLVGAVIYAYAITNFKLFSIQSALDQFRLFPIAYKVAFSIAAVAVLSFALFQIPIVWWSFADRTAEAWKRYLVFSVITALVPNLLLVALVIRIISRPLRRLTEAAVDVAGGAYGTQVALKSNDEVGLLAASFNEMSRKMAEDIERLRSMSEYLVRAEKLAATGALAAGVAHEVNNPLASISSLIQILQSRPLGAENEAEAREMLRLVSTQIDRISHVLRDMMDFARQRQPERAPLDVAHVVESSLRLASFDRAFKRLRVTTEFDDDVPQVLADADQLQQVFLNLLLNARDAMSEGGELDIRVSFNEYDSEVIITLSDTGHGIPVEALPHVFDPFFTTKRAGAGLGLAVCQAIVTAHGGRIRIDPNEIATGTTVYVSLPSGAAAAKGLAQGAAAVQTSTAGEAFDSRPMSNTDGG
ncbi:MAG: two-component system, NtrC family, sensor kinase [Acidobacteriota bacterium]|jgi:signal transduction histidine kinase|nr:two-component system, NtrC family, sensor kinase [Acidobacteriota bacterium]